MKKIFTKGIFRLLRYAIYAAVLLLLLLIAIPYFFSGEIENQVKQRINTSINGKVTFKKAQLSLFRHFPNLTLSMQDFSVLGSAPFEQDTLFTTSELAFGINLKSLIFDAHTVVDQIITERASINILINEEGAANYNIFKAVPADTLKGADTADLSIKLAVLSIKNSRIVYHDQSLDLLLRAEGLQYEGTGDLSKKVFRLMSDVRIDSFHLAFDRQIYFTGKQIKANHITSIDTKSFAFIFEHNKIMLNELPVDFTGSLDFLDNGSSMDLKLTSINTKLEDIFTALPPEYTAWKNKTRIGGTADIHVALKGDYIASQNRMPSADFSVIVRNGLVQHEQAPLPASDIYLNLQAQLPSMEPDSLKLAIDSMYLNLGKNYLRATLRTENLSNPFVDVRIQTRMDLQQLDQALGLPWFHIKGKLQMDLAANGQFVRGVDPKSIRGDTVIQKIPAFSLNLRWQDGYFKYEKLPQAITNLQLHADMYCKSNDYRDTRLQLYDLAARSGNNQLKLQASADQFKRPDITLHANIRLQLDEIKNMIPLQAVEIAGLFRADLQASGKLDPAQGLYPLAKGTLSWTGGSFKSVDHPVAVTAIALDAAASHTGNQLRNQQVVIHTASFEIEGNKAGLRATLKNFRNPYYDVHFNGALDLAKLHAVAAGLVPPMQGEVTGNLHFRGRYSDAVDGQYTRLYNEGVLQVKNFSAQTETLALPLEIPGGVFRFRDDKMWFDRFILSYGKTVVNMNGYMQNVPAYFLTKDALLVGKFQLRSARVNADALMMPATPAENSSTAPQPPAAQVLMVPTDLDVEVTSEVDHLLFKGVHIRNISGVLAVKKGRLLLRDAGFRLAGSDVTASADYANRGTRSAQFQFAVKATDFDVKKMYDSVPMFREMVTAARHAQGRVSLEYQLKGKLNSAMQPVYPSLEGGGVLSVKNVKLKGFRLMNAVSKATGEEGIANPDISNVKFTTSIKNNVITLERVRIKMSGFRLRVQGQSDFNGRIKFKMRLGLPPLGIIGIPMDVSGTQTKPVIKVRKGTGEGLEEAEEVEEEAEQ